MAGLQFRSAALIKETIAFKGIASRFLESADSWILDELVSRLRQIESANDQRARTLQFERLRTKASKCYEAWPKVGGVPIRAQMSGIWNLRRVASGKSGDPKVVEFSGKASTVVELFEEGSSEHLAMWRIELGAPDSPGCYFHVHLENRHQPPFAKGIPIPRLPSIFVTPMATMEFVLGELFQKKWDKATSKNLTPQTDWRSIQQDRLCRLLEWQRDQVRQAGPSPWMALKDAKPNAGLFLP